MRDHATVAETLALHFASIADNIDDDTAKRLSGNDLSYHPSVTQISVKFCNEQTIALELTNETQVQCTLESLKINKSMTPS